MNKILLFSFLVALAFSDSFGQNFKTASEVSQLNDTYKSIYFDELSDTIDNITQLSVSVDSSFLKVQDLPKGSPILKMIEYIKVKVRLLDSSDLSKGDSSNLYPISLDDSIFCKNTYFRKEGKILKITNVISVPHLDNEASIYYHNDRPYKSFWAFTKEPYLMVFSFYYFQGKCISDDTWEDFEAYAPFEYLRAINLLEDYKKKSVQ